MARPAMGERESSLTKALRYVSEGWPVFPVHCIRFEAGQPFCSCSKPRKCDRKGKHPRTKNGLKDATLDEAQVKRWHRKWPKTNWGIRTGEIAPGKHLVVIDIDPHKGGDLNLATLEKRFTTVPDTMTVLTGGGGQHFYFYSDKPVQNSVDFGNTIEGIDVRGTGGYVVAPPSNHESGGGYQWDVGSGPGIAKLPNWLIPPKRMVGVHTDEKDNTTYAVGGRNDHLASVAGSLRRRGLGTKVIIATLLAENAEKCRPPLDEIEVARIAKSIARYKPAASEIESGAKPDWWGLLKVTAEGKIKKSPGNASVLLCHREEWRGVLLYDDFADAVIWVKDAPDGGGPGRPVEGEDLIEHHIGYVTHWLARFGGPDFTKDAVATALVIAARQNTVHPVKSYLTGLEWDGVPRIATWLTHYLGCYDKPYTRSVGRWWMISAVARILKPGCQADHVLVLEGEQGIGKSTCARTLAGKWYLGSLPDLRSKDCGHALQGNWIVEVGELDAFRGAGGTRVKDYISQVVDTYRPAYARLFVRRPRQCVFLATTNEHAYLEDATGARRFWPVKCTKLKRGNLFEDRDQLWAEAVHLFRTGHQWHPTEDMKEDLKEAQEERHRIDPWEEKLAPWIGMKTFLTNYDLLVDGLNFEPARIEMRHYQRVGKIMHRLGWINGRRRRDGKLQRGFYKLALGAAPPPTKDFSGWDD